jgi:hypothetical protein
MTDEHRPHAASRSLHVEPEATSSSLMVQCSKHVIPPAIEVDLTDRPAHGLELGLEVLAVEVLTGQRLGTIVTSHRSAMVDPH